MRSANGLTLGCAVARLRVIVSGLGVLGCAGVTLITAPATAAAKGGLQCGSVVQTSVTLDHDILHCPVDGLIVGASGITIDLNGHKITGTTGDGSGNLSDCDCGINDQGGFDRVTVRPGEIDNFDSGVVFSDARGLLVQDLTAGEHYDDGVAFDDGSRGGLVTDSSFVNSYRGVAATPSASSFRTTRSRTSSVPASPCFERPIRSFTICQLTYMAVTTA
jgi:hypothetical protein